MPASDDLPALAPATTLSVISQLAEIPEEEIWLAKQKSARTRRAYKFDVQHFMRTLHITSYDELRKVDHRAVIAWERMMREIDEAEPSTVRRRLAALSSLFKHLVRHHHVKTNPVADVEQPAINRREGSTLAFSKADAAKLLNTPAEDTIEGLRDRAILSVGLQVGLRRAEIAGLSVEDLNQNRGFDSLRIVRKGGRCDALAIHPNVAQRIRAYLDHCGSIMPIANKRRIHIWLIFLGPDHPQDLPARLLGLFHPLQIAHQLSSSVGPHFSRTTFRGYPRHSCSRPLGLPGRVETVPLNSRSFE
jgi:site-specific recombinase XerD